MFYHHFVYIYALFFFIGDNSRKEIKKEEKARTELILHIGKENRDQEFSFDES